MRTYAKGTVVIEGEDEVTRTDLCRSWHELPEKPRILKNGKLSGKTKPGTAGPGPTLRFPE